MIKIIIFFFFFPVFNMFSQTSSVNIADSWEKLLLYDDYEKNYRLSSFLEMLSENVFYDADTLPSGWICRKMPGTDYHFLAGILPFAGQYSHLIWLLSSEKEETSRVFNKKLDFPGLPATEISVDFADINSTPSLSININDKKYTDIPDIQIKILFSELKNCIIDDKKEQLSREIWERLRKLLANGQTFDNDFSDFELLATVISSNKKVKICTWNIEYSSGEQFFFGGLALNGSSEPTVYELKDERGDIKNPAQMVLPPDKWYGCIYYNILENRYKEDTYYTLIGFNGNNAFSQIKLVDVLTFSEKENILPKFGAQIFTDIYKNNRRLIFEYGKNVTMMLRYDSKAKMIVMDNLSPSEPFFNGDFRFYGPDFSYNGLKFDKGKWYYHSDIDLRNPSN